MKVKIGKTSMKDWNGDGDIDGRDYYDDLGGAIYSNPDSEESFGPPGGNSCGGCLGVIILGAFINVLFIYILLCR